MTRPVIGYTIELEDPLLAEVEPSLRKPAGAGGRGGGRVAAGDAGARRRCAARAGRRRPAVRRLRRRSRALPPGAPPHDQADPPRPRCLRARARARRAGARDPGARHLPRDPGARGRRRRRADPARRGAAPAARACTSTPGPDLAIAPPGDHWHEVEVEPGSSAEAWFEGGNRRVNSFHHQAVARTGARLSPTVRTPDGVIEAIERTDGAGWAAGVQWHNELDVALRPPLPATPHPTGRRRACIKGARHFYASVAQDGLRRVIAGQAGEAAAGVGARAAQVEARAPRAGGGPGRSPAATRRTGRVPARRGTRGHRRGRTRDSRSAGVRADFFSPARRYRARSARAP